MWESRSDFQGGGKGGKPGFGFPGFPRTVISTAFWSVRFYSLLLLLRGAAEAIRFCAGLQDVSAVGDAIEQRFAQPRVGNDLRPLGERQVCGQHHRRPLGALGHHLKQELGADLCQRDVSDLIDGDQIVAALP